MNIGKMMKNLQEMQSKMQEEVQAIEVEGRAGGGAVAVRMNGKKELLSVQLDKSAVDPEDLDLLGDLLVAAVNDAGRQVDERMQQVTQGLAGGLNIPGLT